MNRALLYMALAAILLSFAIGTLANFDFPPERHDHGLLLVKAITEADIIVVAKMEYVSSTKDETILKVADVKTIYDGSKRRGAQSQPAKATESQPASAPADILLVLPKEVGPSDPLICPRSDVQIAFLKVADLSPGEIRDYRKQCVQELEEGAGTLTPAEKDEVESRIKDSAVFCRLLGDTVDVTPESKFFEGKMFKEQYKMTKAEEIIGAVKALCAWRELKTRQEKLDYLVKLLNDNPKNVLYLDNVPGLLEHLNAKLETKNGRYVAKDADNSW